MDIDEGDAQYSPGVDGDQGRGSLVVLYLFGISDRTFRLELLEKDGQFGIYNVQTNKIIAATMNEIAGNAEPNGWYRVKKNGKWGWIGENGTVKIPFQFDVITPFKNGKAWVMRAPYTHPFLVNTRGEAILNSFR